ncbi:4,5-DOPA-extradiol-dioxygenase [Undibacterium flavidum]|uniref:4,5-DOPA dioxygenase extradiol n=1 Tax=Undibacterium flavidum TaxID=2762297 RepID=A0ABR6YH40_9BURK|nr:4,5-DOPA dioxygenase extradiol [Undibacterium flavidum]MBC3875858.1 4,5-DOPA dioxygenase extradiol [Undibacterium flavidum]
MSARPQPAIFLGHGSPMNALEDNQFTRAWQTLGQGFGKPKAILMISAHWMTSAVAVTAMTQPKTIHDFGGFPPALFAMQYPAPGDPVLAQRVADMLAPLAVHQDHSWGLDHGTWSVLVKMYPDADVPIVQLSLNLNEDEAFHYALGQKLAALRDEGVMIIASGNVVHNLRRLDPRASGNNSGFEWAHNFNNAIRTAIEQRDFAAVVNYQQFGQSAELSVPTVEHYLPLLYVLGAANANDQIEILCDELVMGSISMMSVVVHAETSV